MSWKSIAVATVAAVIVLGAWRKASIVLGSDTVGAPSTPATAPASDGPLAYTMKDIDGHDVNLADYKGKVVMIVNVASRCGFTKQYAGLEKLYETYKGKGFVILGFPANNFNGQEPGSDDEIKAFCTATYGVSFPMFSKVSVKGGDQTPLYKYLTDKDTAGQYAGPIGWNFTKFLVDKQGHVYARFASKTTPQDKDLVDAVEKGLNG